ncbi:unnamed protein product [Ectocarpus sp. 13 AM-2016]
MLLLRALLFVPSVLGIKPSVVAGIDARLKATLPAGQQRSWVDIPRSCSPSLEGAPPSQVPRFPLTRQRLLGCSQLLQCKVETQGEEVGKQDDRGSAQKRRPQGSLSTTTTSLWADVVVGCPFPEDLVAYSGRVVGTLF